MKHSMGEKTASPPVCRKTFQNGGGGQLYVTAAWPGVEVRVTDFHMAQLEVTPVADYRFMKLNYCLSGRCEIRLPDKRYVYLSSGLLSVDLNQPSGNVSFPSGAYQGLEIVIDLKKLENSPMNAWLEYGVDMLEWERKLRETAGSYLATASPAWNRKAMELAEFIKTGNPDMEDCRFLLLELLRFLQKEERSIQAAGGRCLTPGQRAVAMRAEEAVTRDLKKRYGIEELAAAEGVSPSSLKKHFVSVYGKTISAYLREKRMEKAKELLSAGGLSIADVAGEVGYENQGKFGAVFRREEGMTPLEYRRLHPPGRKSGEMG